MRAFALVVPALVAPLFLSPPALAQPFPPNCVVPCGLRLVGTTGGVADPLGEFVIIVNDAAGLPVPLVPVIINFTGCVPDIEICAAQAFPDVSSVCAAPVGSVGTVTDAAGVATFRINGGAGNLGGGGLASGFQCATVLAGLPPVLIGPINVAAFDLNSVGGVNPVDISLWLTDSFDPGYEGRADYNCSGTINPADLAALLNVALTGGSVASCAAYCF